MAGDRGPKGLRDWRLARRGTIPPAPPNPLNPPKAEALLIKDVCRATGLHEQTIRDLDRRGIIASTRDYRGWRVFAPEVVSFLNRIYKREMELAEPTVFMEMDAASADAAQGEAGALTYGGDGDYLMYGAIHSTTGTEGGT